MQDKKNEEKNSQDLDNTDEISFEQNSKDSPTTSYDPCTNKYDSDFYHPADRAEQLETLTLERQICVLLRIAPEEAAETLAELDNSFTKKALENLDAASAARIVAAMPPDDAADILDRLDESHRAMMLSNMAHEDALALLTLMSFDPNTAAGVMNTELILIPENMLVDDVMKQIRTEFAHKEMVYYVYVVDDTDKLLGILSLKELILAHSHASVNELLGKHELITVTFDTDKVEVARILSHYNFLSVPVVNKEGHIMGSVTHDDVIDIIHEDASSDLLGMVGAGQDENVDTPWTTSIKLRLPWLFINMLNSCIVAWVVYLFEGTIAQMAFLAVLMPIVANQAGNTGQQALAVMIRQLAREKFDRKKSWKAVWREGKIGFSIGLIVACVALIGVWIVTDNYMLALIMGGALMLDILLGALAGASIPLFLKAMGRDPAQASSIFLTAITDSAGFFIFLGLASLFLM